GAAAARALREWIAAGILAPDPEPALYLYTQQFSLPDGSTRRRDGLLCRLRLEDFSSGVVRPHERTLPGPKADRLALLRATGGNLGATVHPRLPPEHGGGGRGHPADTSTGPPPARLRRGGARGASRRVVRGRAGGRAPAPGRGRDRLRAPRPPAPPARGARRAR